MSNSKKSLSYFSNLCPVCKEGKIFRGLVSMNKACPKCGNVFEKETGYFVGAMIASYFLGILLVAPTLVICLFSLQLEIPAALGIGVAQLVLMQPFLFRFSRLIWIQLEYQLSHAVQSK